MYIYPFEKLFVWQEAKTITKIIYEITQQSPENEKFGLTSQLRRASVSICSNIAEGTSRNSCKDQAHFSTMAFSSAMEVINQLILCKELNFILESDYIELRSRLNSITNKLNALRRRQLSKSGTVSNEHMNK